MQQVNMSVKRFAAALAVLGIAAGLVIPAFAADELSVQGSTAAGGSATVIVGRVYGEVRFSITGKFNDVAGVTLGNGVLAFESTVRDIWNGNGGPMRIISREQLPDGRSRVIMIIPSAQPIFNGGSVRLRSGNVLLDSDPIILR